MGTVFAVRDPEKSEALWNQILRYPPCWGRRPYGHRRRSPSRAARPESTNYPKPHSSKAIIVHAARMLEVVASVDPRATRDLQQLQAFAGNLTVSLATVENPNSLAVRAQITGLPDVPKIVKQIAQASRATAIRRSVAVVPSQP